MARAVPMAWRRNDLSRWAGIEGDKLRYAARPPPSQSLSRCAGIEDVVRTPHVFDSIQVTLELWPDRMPGIQSLELMVTRAVLVSPDLSLERELWNRSHHRRSQDLSCGAGIEG